MTPILEVKNLSKRFGGIVAVDDISFSVEEGQMSGIIGPNGAGKTTLFNLINGFIRTDTGSILFEERDITGLKPHEISLLGVSRTFQLVRSFKDMSVAENVTTPLILREGEVDGKRVDEILIAVGLKEKEDFLAKSLTYVEMKSLEIARAIISRPKLLLIDEPFGGLNVQEAERIMTIIKRLHSEGQTVIIIEHRLAELLELVKRVIVINFGKLIADGTPEEVLEDKDVIEAYFGEGEFESVAPN